MYDLFCDLVIYTSYTSFVGRVGKRVTFQFAADFLFRRKIGQILAGENLLRTIQNGIFNDSFIFVCTEQDANGRIISGTPFEVIEHTDIHIHLPDIAVCEFGCLEVNQHKALEQVVVKHQIDIEMLRFCTDAVLAFDK